jgi:FlaA1/EpsC-like NDP-sugar epimerase
MGSRFFEKLFTLIFDLMSFAVAFIATFWLRYQSNLFPESFDPAQDLSSYILPLIIMGCAWVLLFFITGLYRDWYKESRFDEFFVVSRTVIIGTTGLFLVTGAPQLIQFATSGDFSVFFTRTKFATLLTYGGCMLFFATLNRFSMHSIASWLFTRGIGTRKMLIIGANEFGEKLAAQMRKFPQLGYRITGFLDDDGRKKSTVLGGYPVLGTYSDLHSVIKHQHISGLIISHVSASANEILKIVDYAGDARVTIYIEPSLMDVITGHLKTHQIFGVPLMLLLQDHMPAWEAQIKRLMDITVSAVILLAGAPFWLILCWIIKLTSSGPVIYKQERVGRNGKPFIMMKYRSMYQDAEKRSGPVWAKENDPRITPVGRFIRKTRLMRFHSS